MMKGLVCILACWSAFGLFANCQPPIGRTNSSTTGCSVIYHGDGSTGGSVPVDGNKYQPGAAVTVLDNTGDLVNAGHGLAGWNTQPDRLGTSYAAGASFVMGAADANLYPVWIPDNLKFSSSGTNITITGYYTAPTGVLTIPAGVTGLIAYVFKNCTGLTSVTLPSSVTGIGDGAFQGCSQLTDIAIPLSITSIAKYLFYDCISLTGVTIPSNATSIGYGAFESCRGLTGIVIPASLRSIGDYAFYGCTGLTDIAIPAGVESIGYRAFAGCSSLAGISVDPDNEWYESMSGVLFNKAGTTLLQAPGGLTGDYAIPASVTSIADSSFIYCVRLSGVSIPGDIADIGDFAFYDCYGLSSVDVPANFKALGASAFRNCSGLASVNIAATVPPALASGSRAFDACDSKLKIYVPEISLADYQTAQGWSEYYALGIIVSP
jgi:hypothetical protein